MVLGDIEFDWGVLWIPVVLFFAYLFVAPRYQLWRVRRLRERVTGRLEEREGSEVLTMIHGKTPVSLLGFPSYQFIDVEDAEQVIRGIRKAGRRPVDLVMHTPGGQLNSSVQIARALKNHPERTRVLVPHYAMSGGTIIAMGADEVVMDPDAALGPIDPQLGDFIRGQFPARAWMTAAEEKGEDAEDATIAMRSVSEKAVDAVRSIALELVEGTVEDPEEVVERLVSGDMIHSYPLSPGEVEEMGLRVSTELPGEVHDLMDTYIFPASMLKR